MRLGQRRQELSVRTVKDAGFVVVIVIE